MRSHYIQTMLTLSNRYIEVLPHFVNGIQPISSTQMQEQDLYYDMQKFTHAQWLQKFRMSKTTFLNLCNALEDVLCPDASKPYRHKIPTNKRVAIALYGMATGEEYRKIAELFQVSRVTVSKFIRLFAQSLLKKLGSGLIKLPHDCNEYTDISEGLAKLTKQNIRLCAGILGHYELAVERSISEGKSPTDWLVVQAFIDDRLLFRQIEINLNKMTCMFMEPNGLENLPVNVINQQKISSFLVTNLNDNMPLLPWIVHGYRHPATENEYSFNRDIDNILELKDKSFRHLLARWQILNRQCDMELDTLKLMIRTCCALHNLLEESEEEYLQEWEQGIKETKFECNNFKCDQLCVPENSTSLAIRDMLAGNSVKNNNI